MKPVVRDSGVILGFGLLGALACLLVGNSPASVKPREDPGLVWDTIRMRLPDLAVVDAAWETRAPWGAAPRPVEPPPPPPPPPPTPVGIAGRGRNLQAIFMIHGEGGVRVPVGGKLPDGGQVLRIHGMQVDWVDGEGERHQRRLFVDPQQPQAAGAAE
ncbi:hypothetical protein [Luteimonas terrae]|uniref:Type II secretion system protein GspC N-terminal domain-containing protein n=1 Tax=Luteimonas terrae TaxID=1530191 RepID=A0A4R5U6V3_9GAMM|nr:hypothetical protein [Luteimonas terrae]TDK29981.1 hypothetical protein E2F49_12305 [Luteimonas terrae]